MAEDLIRYDIIVQDALRGAVRKILAEIARTGLPGDHHFYISLSTTAPGVRISSRLRERYPDEMTIVLQHQFWDLAVHEHAFEVGLSFNGVPERLLVPFAAIKGFFDPSVQFALEFEPRAQAADLPEGVAEAAADIAALEAIEDNANPRDDDDPGQASQRLEGDTANAARPPKPPKPRAPDRDGLEKSPSKTRSPTVGSKHTVHAEEDDKAEAASRSEGAAGADVVSLDSFRKKN